MALEEMDEVSDRDAVLDLFFEFARQFFEYTVFFMVRAESADGRDAFGTGLPRDKVTALTVPLEEPNMIAIVRDKRTPTLMLPATRVDAGLLAELRIDPRTPLLLYPLVVRKKTVAILLGDAADSGVDSDVIEDLGALAGAAGSAFERLIVRRKLAAAGVQAPPDSPAPDTDAPVTAIAPFERAPSPAPFVSPSPVVVESPPPPVIIAATNGVDGADASSRVAEGSVIEVPPPAVVFDREAVLPPKTNPEQPSSEIPSTVVERVRLVPEHVDEPPPATAVQVRRPSGPPIPREEPNRDLRGGFNWDEYVPPSSDQRSVAPRRPPAPRHTQPPLPSVIVEVDQDMRGLVDRYLKGDESAGTLLLRAGQHAMPAIMERFPGPLTIERSRFLEPNPPPAQNAGPLLRLIAGQRRVAFPFVIARAEDPDPAKRMLAVLLVSELPYPEAIKPIVSRLFDPDPGVRIAARIAGRSIAEHHAQSIVERIAAIASSQEEPLARRVGAVEALGELREPLAATLLVNALVDPTREIQEASHVALRVLTRHDFGGDPRPWLSFLQSSGALPRAEWLIAAVGGDDETLAVQAEAELSAAAKRSFGFRQGMSKEERRQIATDIATWWENDAKGRPSRRRGL
jgi:hypothetical protein